MELALRPRLLHRSTGWIIGGGAVLSVLLMLRHPSIQSHTMSGAIAQIGEKALVNAWVHGGLIATIVAIFAGLCGFAQYLGWELTRVRFGAVFYAAGALGLVGAALINGFVTTGLAATYAGQPEDVVESLKPVFVACHEVNQTLAQAGTMAISIAILAWSMVLIGRGKAARIIGGLGMVIGVLPIAGLLSGLLRLDVHGMGIVVLLQAIWNLCVGIWLARQARG
ncbi:MAG TPA: hypothetical protein VK843_07500 [Planctomycetota bacterium]|nr:hypothetical protein [Planctomycetota bacterium]